MTKFEKKYNSIIPISRGSTNDNHRAKLGELNRSTVTVVHRHHLPSPSPLLHPQISLWHSTEIISSAPTTTNDDDDVNVSLSS
jgi:hypothetical protein